MHPGTVTLCRRILSASLSNPSEHYLENRSGLYKGRSNREFSKLGRSVQTTLHRAASARSNKLGALWANTRDCDGTHSHSSVLSPNYAAWDKLEPVRTLPLGCSLIRHATWEGRNETCLKGRLNEAWLRYVRVLGNARVMITESEVGSSCVVKRGATCTPFHFKADSSRHFYPMELIKWRLN